MKVYEMNGSLFEGLTYDCIWVYDSASESVWTCMQVYKCMKCIWKCLKVYAKVYPKCIKVYVVYLKVHESVWKYKKV